MVDPVNILIVDDKQDNIVALEALLDRKDIKLISTTSPNEALRICWEHEIAIALVDVQMPGMDGFELVEILKSNSRTQDILVIFVTAISTETKYAVKGLSSGAVDYLYKPLNPYITSAKVDSFIRLVRAQLELKKKNAELNNYQKELIKAKEQAEQGKRIKESFLANMSHEIRTPIHGIIGLAYILRNTDLDSEQKEIVDLIDNCSQSLLGVINDILDISKIEAGKFKIARSETNIVLLAQSVIDLLKFKATEKNIHLSLNISSDCPHLVIADSLRLNQILMNLIGNGIKFTEKGEVKLEVNVLESKGNSSKIEFSVTDTGIGIPRDKLKQIFKSFEQAGDTPTHRFGGTGLGLTITKKLAELKGGMLSVKSVVGKGSKFTFTNWYQVTSEKKTKSPLKEVAANLPGFDNLHVLVAEDNAVSQLIIKKVLTNWNIVVDIVEDGSKILEKLRDNQYDLILMDTYMPVMGGYETTRRIRTEMTGGKQNIPIISLSAAVLQGEQKEAIDSGVNEIVSKPFDPVTLYYKIDRLVRKQ
jgi:signal transduction histidine kinase